MGGEVVLIMKFIGHHESSKGMEQFEDVSLTTHCQNVGIVFNVETLDLGRIIFFKKL